MSLLGRGVWMVVGRASCSSRLLPHKPATLPRSISYDGHEEEKALRKNALNSDDPDRPIMLARNPYEKEARQCILCSHKDSVQLDYKNPRLLQQFVSTFSGRIYPRHITGLCQKQHDNLMRTIALSRRCGYMPVLVKDPRFVRDPKLYDPLRPSRPHSFA